MNVAIVIASGLSDMPDSSQKEAGIDGDFPIHDAVVNGIVRHNRGRNVQLMVSSQPCHQEKRLLGRILAAFLPGQRLQRYPSLDQTAARNAIS